MSARPLPIQPVSEPVRCVWRTGVQGCRMLPTSGRHCAWHGHWMRLVDVGNVGRQQYAEFCDWWELFQPYGIYGDHPGQWWADKHVLWQALMGEGQPPVLSESIANELLLRRAEVRRYRQGVAWGADPWARVDETPLPRWIEEEWKNKIHGSSLATNPCG